MRTSLALAHALAGTYISLALGLAVVLRRQKVKPRK